MAAPPKFFLALHRNLYKLSKGRLGGKMFGMNVLLLTTTGRKTGQQRTLPISYVKDEAGHYVITGTNGGDDKPPAWWLNLQANPHATLQVMDQELEATAEEIPSGPEYDRLYAKFEAMQSGYKDYKQKTTRHIPLVRFHPR